MELNWTSFILESINFLVLIWILKRLFFAPVQRMIAERRAAVQKQLGDAETKSKEAEELRGKYENRLQEWEQEKEHERELLRKSLDEERVKQMKRIEESVLQERERMQAQETKRTAELQEKLQVDAITQALSFLSRFLKQFASPELEREIVSLTLQHFRDVNAPELHTFRSGTATSGARVQLRSAFALNDSIRADFHEAFKKILNRESEVEFGIDPSLLAGVEISYGAAVLQANLRDELRFFSEAR